MKIRLLVLMGAVVLPGCDREPATPEMKTVVGTANRLVHKQNDFGRVPSQSFEVGRTGEVAGIQLLIAGRENPRDLLVMLRTADANGYPSGAVIASGIATIPVSTDGEPDWHDVALDPGAALTPGTPYTFELIPSTPRGGYGYFEYAHSIGNPYAEGRFHPSGPGRRVPDDDGSDLCFSILLRVPAAEEGSRVELEPTRAEPVPLQPPRPQDTPPRGNPTPELDRLLAFTRLRHLDFSGYPGHRLQIWADLGEPGTEGIEDTVIPPGDHDLYYGHSESDQPMFHLIGADGSGGTRLLPNTGRLHYFPDVSPEQALGRALMIGKEYSGDARIWLRLDPAAPDR